MSIHNTQFQHGLFFAQEVGHISKADAERWALELRECATTSSCPIAAVVDAHAVSFISMDARMIFARATATPNLKAVCVATDSPLTAQTARMIGMLGEPGCTYVFGTIEEAQEFALQQINGVASAS